MIPQRLMATQLRWQQDRGPMLGQCISVRVLQCLSVEKVSIKEHEDLLLLPFTYPR